MKRSPLAPMSAKRRADMKKRTTVREQVLERDGYECQFWHKAHVNAMDWPNAPIACDQAQLDVHEIIPRSADPTAWLRPEACVTLCRRHHDWVGDHPTLAHEIGLHGFSWERE